MVESISRSPVLSAAAATLRRPYGRSGLPLRLANSHFGNHLENRIKVAGQFGGSQSMQKVGEHVFPYLALALIACCINNAMV
jgi:hypothetical protein